MKNLIIYSTKYGTSKEVSEKLKDKIKGETDIIDLKSNKIANLNVYENIIIGGSIYAGMIQKEMTKFINKNLDNLLSKRLFLFICAGSLGNEERDKEQLKGVFLEDLYNHATFKSNLGFRIDFNKMNPLERLVIKKLKGVKENITSISENNIDAMAQKINNK